MKKTEKKRRSSHRKIDIKKLIAIIIGAAIVFYFAYTLVTQQISINKKNDEIKELESQVQAAEGESDKLKSELENLQDPEYIEKIAREKLGLVRPNERVFVDSNKSENNKGN